ncbi:CopG-like ribbon-helix-helix domain-containing protein [Nostoc sp. DSM 114167]
MCFNAFNIKVIKIAYDDDMAKVTVTIYMEEEDKEALQLLADAEERSLSQMAVLIVKRAIKQAQNEGKIPPSQGK